MRIWRCLGAIARHSMVCQPTARVAVAARRRSFVARRRGGSFNERSQGGQEAPAKTQKTETTATTATTSNSKKTIVIALVAAVALLLAIAFVIVRDARKVAPA